MRSFDHGYTANEDFDMQEIRSERSYDELVCIGESVARLIQKEYELSYAEAELVLGAAAVALKNRKLTAD